MSFNSEALSNEFPSSTSSDSDTTANQYAFNDSYYSKLLSNVDLKTFPPQNTSPSGHKISVAQTIRPSPQSFHSQILRTIQIPLNMTPSPPDQLLTKPTTLDQSITTTPIVQIDKTVNTEWSEIDTKKIENNQMPEKKLTLIEIFDELKTLGQKCVEKKTEQVRERSKATQTVWLTETRHTSLKLTPKLSRTATFKLQDESPKDQDLSALYVDQRCTWPGCTSAALPYTEFYEFCAMHLHVEHHSNKAETRLDLDLQSQKITNIEETLARERHLFQLMNAHVTSSDQMERLLDADVSVSSTPESRSRIQTTKSLNNYSTERKILKTPAQQAIIKQESFQVQNVKKCVHPRPSASKIQIQDEKLENSSNESPPQKMKVKIEGLVKWPFKSVSISAAASHPMKVVKRCQSATDENDEENKENVVVKKARKNSNKRAVSDSRN